MRAMRTAILSVLVAGALVAIVVSRPQAGTSAIGQAADASAQADATTAASAFAASLSGPSKAKALLALADEARTQMNYVPMVRAGVPLEELNDAQRESALALLRTGLGDAGYARARAIIAHEDILRELEREQGVSSFNRRQPGFYYTAIFGTPAATGFWGWRFEGHHLSVNVTHRGVDGQIVAPLFLGANPARVPSGPHAGLRILAAEEDEARALLNLLSGEQRTRAVIAPTTTNDIHTTNVPSVSLTTFEGLPASAMTAEQRKQLRALIELYASRFPKTQRDAQIARIETAGFEKVYFAWAGGLETGQKHYYRLHGPTFLVEYDNSQNNANHIHSVWRDPEHDFGGDLLRKHLATVKH